MSYFEPPWTAKIHQDLSVGVDLMCSSLVTISVGSLLFIVVGGAYIYRQASVGFS